MEQEKSAVAAFYPSPFFFSNRKRPFKKNLHSTPRAIFTKQRESSFTKRPDSFQEFEKAEVKQKIKQILSENSNDEFFESSNQGLNLNCTLKVDDFDSCEDSSKKLAKTIAKFVGECDGYSYK